MGTKTIIITAMPSKQGSVAIHRPAGGVALAALPVTTGAKRMAPAESLVPAVPRKRERLTHLTAEEKLNRRKLKNRIAAQTARDRKKLRMNRLEQTTDGLAAENDALSEENEALRARNEQLEAEREELQKQLAELKEASGETRTFGSAASISAPLQRDQVLSLPPTPALLQLLTTLLTLSSPNSSPTISLPPVILARLEETQATLQKGLPLSRPQLQQLADLWRRARKK